MTTWEKLESWQCQFFVDISIETNYSVNVLLWAWESIYDKIDSLLGETIYVCELGDILTREENIDGYIGSYYQNEAMQWIANNYGDCALAFDNIKSIYGENIVNPFSDPCGFQVIVFIDVIDNILHQLDFYNSKCNEKITVTKHDIDTLKYELAMIDKPEDKE